MYQLTKFRYIRFSGLIFKFIRSLGLIFKIYKISRTKKYYVREVII